MKHCLIIDDNNPEAEIYNLEKRGKDISYGITCHYFNPIQDKYLAEGMIKDRVVKVIDKYSVLEGLQSEYDGKQQFDLIASDFDFADEGGTNGLNLLQFLKENKWRSKIPSIVYSTVSDTIKENLQREIENVREDKNKLTKYLENYYKNHPNHTIDKREFTESIIQFLKQNKFSMTVRLADEMLKHGEKTFENIMDKQFEGKTLSELATLIQQDTNESYAFKTEFLERCIAHFIFLEE